MRFNEHLNPRLYRYAPHVQFHIQNVNHVSGVALCGAVFSSEKCNVFSDYFFFRFHGQNQCSHCALEYYRIPVRISAAQKNLAPAKSADSRPLSILKKVLS